MTATERAAQLRSALNTPTRLAVAGPSVAGNPGNSVQFTNLSKEASYEVFFNGNEPVIVNPGQTFTERLPFPQGGEDSAVFFDPYGTVIHLPNPCIKG